MAGKQAKILSVSDVNDLLVFARCTRHPLRNRVIVLLAAKAGLRAGEVANLTWDMVVDPTGDIGSVIELRDHAAKNGSGRLIPVHPDLANPSTRIEVSVSQQTTFRAISNARFFLRTYASTTFRSPCGLP
jgi:integrase